MKKVCSEQVFLRATLALLLLPAMTFARVVRGDNHATAADSIDVIGHLALTNASVTSLKTSLHWRRQFLQLQDSTHRMLTLVDVTDATHPAVVKQLHLPTEPGDCNLAVLVGDVALLTGTDTRFPEARISSVSVVRFADPDHPTTVRKFKNVSAFRTDEGRGLIYLVDEDGLWILREKPAPDEELEREYARSVLYNH
jgi:hypothetical protein